VSYNYRRVLRQIKHLLHSYYESESAPGRPGPRIPLNVPTFGEEEVYAAIEAMLSTNVTMGKNVREFEGGFARYIGMKEGVMVNSGSSANLVALSALSNPLFSNPISRGSEIVTAAVTWSTTVWPIINVGCVPVFVDVDPKTYNIDADKIEEAITEKTRAIVAVNLLGNPCEMKKISEIAQRHNLFVVEDTCESHGSMIGKRKAGSFGHLSTFSFFFSHHISTVEGGMVLTSNPEMADIARMLRAHGWIRESKDRQAISQRNPELDPRFLFSNIGYNLRPSEIQAAFGNPQLAKLEGFIRIRRENAKFWTESLKRHEKYLGLPEERKGTRHVYFGYPITVKPSAPFNRKQLTDYLESKGIETRPIMAGNITEQPAMQLFDHRVSGDLEASRTIMRDSFFFGNHHRIGERDRGYVVDCIDRFIKTKA
jgi:dTDP-4-amino-4,6-dideoxygalactose transaminase